MNERFREHRYADQQTQPTSNLPLHCKTCKTCECTPQYQNAHILACAKDEITREIIEAYLIITETHGFVSTPSILLSHGERNLIQREPPP